MPQLYFAQLRYLSIIVLAWLLLNEHPAARTLGGGFLILCAVIWASFTQGRSAST